MKKRYIIILGVSLIFNVFTVYHFLTFNHNKVKIKKVVKKEKIVDENILFLGDSITDFYDLDKYYPNYRKVNSGISGNTTRDILNNMDERVYRYNPSKVFLLIGTNDLVHDIKEEETISNIEKIIENIKNNRKMTEIYLESIYPINDTDNDKIDHDMVNNRKNKNIKKINQTLKDYCKKNHVEYVDMYDELKDEDDNLKIEYTKEGLHMSDKGYKVITKKIETYLKK